MVLIQGNHLPQTGCTPRIVLFFRRRHQEMVSITGVKLGNTSV